MTGMRLSAAALYAQALVDRSAYEQRMADLCAATPITDHDPPGLIKQFADPSREYTQIIGRPMEPTVTGAVHLGVTPDYHTAHVRLTDGSVRTYLLDDAVWRPT